MINVSLRATSSEAGTIAASRLRRVPDGGSGADPCENANHAQLHIGAGRGALDDQMVCLRANLRTGVAWSPDIRHEATPLA